MSDDFWAKYRDPRWQKLKAQVLERESYTCQECGSTTKTLHVHHCFYERNHEPWDYHPNNLKCLCEDCHKIATAFINAVKRSVGRSDISRIIVTFGFVDAMSEESIDEPTLDSMEGTFTGARRFYLIGYARFLCIPFEVLSLSLSQRKRLTFLEVLELTQSSEAKECHQST